MHTNIILKTLKFKWLLLLISFQAFSQDLGNFNAQFSLQELLSNAQNDGINQFSILNDERNDKLNEEQKILLEQQEALYREFKKSMEPSKLEILFSKRANKDLSLRGYRIFDFNIVQNLRRISGSQENYILGIGDEIKLILQGGTSQTINSKINNSGNLVFSFTSPISAEGRPFGEVKNEILQRVNSELIETRAYISLGEIKEISVMVTGEVNAPGIIQLNGLTNIFDALHKAGGVKKTGSLRNIKIINKRNKSTVDLYPFIFGSVDHLKKPNLIGNETLIVVPPIGNTIAISGSVALPGIYELQNDEKHSFDEFINLSGGIQYPGNFRSSLKRIQNNGKEIATGMFNEKMIAQNGDILLLTQSIIESRGGIKVFGSINQTPLFALDNFPTLKSIFKNKPILNNEAYKYYIIHKRKNKNISNDVYSVVNLKSIIDGKIDKKLSDQDEIFVLSNKDLEFLKEEEFFFLLQGKALNKNSLLSCKATKELMNNSKLFNKEQIRYFSLLKVLNEEVNGLQNNFVNEMTDEFQKSTNIESNTNENNLSKKINNHCPEIFNKFPKLLSFVFENSIFIRGDIGKKGFYLYDKSESIETFLDTLNIKNNNYLVSPDKKVLNIMQNLVRLEGAVNIQSEFTIMKNTNIADIFNDIRILNENAYPLFGVVKRKNTFSGSKLIIPFNPVSIFKKNNNFQLKGGDIIKIFSNEEIDLIVEKSKNERVFVSRDEIIPQNETNDKDNNFFLDVPTNSESLHENLSPFDNIKNILNNGSINPKLIKKIEDNFEPDEIKELLNSIENLGKDSLANSIQDNISKDIIKSDSKNKGFDNLINEDLQEDSVIQMKSINQNQQILSLIKDSLVKIEGRVIVPGYYPIGGSIDKTLLIKYVSGFMQDADTNNIEITNLNSENSSISNAIFPGGSIYVPQLKTTKEHIEVLGAIENAGKKSFFVGIELTDIFNSYNNIKDNAYVDFSIIERKSKNKSSKQYIAFSLSEIIEQKSSIKLMPNDKIIIYTNKEIDNLLNIQKEKGKYLTPYIYDGNKLQSNKLNSLGSIEELIRSNVINLQGEVTKNGNILVAGKTNLENVFSIGGGLTNLAQISNIFVSEPKKDEFGNVVIDEKIYDLSKININELEITVGSTIRVNKLKSDLDQGFVFLEGEINQPGKFRIQKGETIFSLLKKGNGLSESAYLQGLVFSRIKEKEREERSIKNLQKELERSIAYAVSSQIDLAPIDSATLTALQQLVISASNFEPRGRVVGDYTNIEILKSIKLTDGDKIFIPKRPTSVTVIGEVMTPGSLIWDNNYSVTDYVENAAGLTNLADKKNIFTIEPNGIASKSSGLWMTKKLIPPGSTIVIPRKIQLSSTLGKISAITSVVYQLTLSLAGIDSILNN